MCLPDFIKIEQVSEDKTLTGYRNWRNLISGSLNLHSSNQNYIWLPEGEKTEVKDNNSGYYSYNNYNNYYNYYYHYYNYYNNNYYNYNYNNYYYIAGIIKQYGKVAIHNTGYRSEYAKIDTLFKIRFSDAEGSDNFLRWINEVFNPRIEAIAEYYKCKTMNWQDFIESNKNKTDG